MERTVLRLHEGFKFLKLDENDETNLSSPTLDDGAWESVTVPHDWAVGHDFKEEYDITYRNILADGINKPIKHSGRTGGLPTIGIGWYRLSLDIPESARGKILELIFDGVMWECEVYLNGRLVGKNHFGYLSFSVDVSNAAVCGGKNLLAVKAVLKRGCSRWYPGAGIYRNLYLVTKSPDSVAYCGIKTQIDTKADGSRADIELTVDTCGAPDCFYFELADRDGNSVLCGEGKGACTATLDSPHLWSLDHPYLYTLRVYTLKNGEVSDADEVRLGFRNCLFTPDKGFFLNGKPTKIHGVCMHHDLGIFGAAVNTSVLRRQLEIMQGMGVNSIRTSHNPPAPELLDFCDEMGILVIDEFFDEWKIPKIECGYAQYFDGHAESDAVAVIRRDINHPSVFMWSIGNEVEEQKSPDGANVAQFLTDICHREDRTRPTTAGFNVYPQAENNGLYDAVDLVGLNYKPHLYKKLHEEYPHKIFYGSETESCISTRGVYKLPVKVEAAQDASKRDDLTVSDYALSSPPWAYYPEREFIAQRDGFVFGEYVWTGFDYMGEPTPYYSEWPARSSYFGIVDLSGLPKSRYWMYLAEWTDEKVLFVMPHWNFEGHEGESIPVHIITSYDKAELFLNGKSLGVREKVKNPEYNHSERIVTDRSVISAYRIIFDVPYEAGELVAVAYGEDGKEAMRTSVKTAGKPYAIRLEAERVEIAADGEDVCYVRAYVVDENGVVCPEAAESISFTAEGAGRIYGTDNGDPRETVGYFNTTRTTLSGACVAALISKKGEMGDLALIAKADGLVSASVKISVK